MDSILAGLILEHGEQLLPYLKLRAYYVKNFNLGDRMPTPDIISKSDIETLRVSGFIKEDSGEITIFENDMWMGYPKEYIPKEKEEKEEYIPEQLEFLANQLGHPVDFYKNIGKYRKLYSLMIKKRSEEDIKQVVVCFLEEKQPDWDLRMILSDKSFNILLRKSRQPDKYQEWDRQEQEYFKESW